MARSYRPRPNVLDDCPIFRNNRVLVGHNAAGRECWFGCLSVEAAEREHEGAEKDSDWYRIWLSDTSDDDILERRYTVTVVEMECITKLLDRNNEDEDALLALSAPDRIVRYARLLHNIDMQRINVREGHDSRDFGVVRQHFIPRARADGKLSLTAGLNAGGRSRGGKRSRDHTSEGGVRLAKKHKVLNESSNANRDDRGDFGMRDVGDDQDDYEDVPCASGEEIESKIENESEICYSPRAQSEDKAGDGTASLYTIPEQTESTTKDEAETPRLPDNQAEMMAQDGNEQMNVDGNGLSISESMMQLKDALRDLYRSDFAREMRPAIDKFAFDAKKNACEHMEPEALDIPAVAISVSLKVLELCAECVQRAQSVIEGQEEFVKFVGERSLTEELNQATQGNVAALSAYINVVSEKAEQVEAKIRQVQEVMRGEEL